jgi:Tetratricopeptide repeat
MRALAITERQLGAEHLDTVNCLANLAALYGDQGKYAEAEPLYHRTLASTFPMTMTESHTREDKPRGWKRVFRLFSQ